MKIKVFLILLHNHYGLKYKTLNLKINFELRRVRIVLEKKKKKNREKRLRIVENGSPFLLPVVEKIIEKMGESSLTRAHPCRMK